MSPFQFAICLRVFCSSAFECYTQVLCISATIVEVNADPLSMMRVVGRYECFVMISISTLTTFAAVASISGYANKYLGKTSIAVITDWYPPLVDKFDNKSICTASSGPRSHSGKLTNSDVIALFATRLSLAHTSHPSTHFWHVLFSLGSNLLSEFTAAFLICQGACVWCYLMRVKGLSTSV